MFDDDDIPDWEKEPEKAPHRLEAKWDQEEQQELSAVNCKSCGKLVPHDALLCMYCGEATGLKVGLFGHLRYWLVDTIVGPLAILILLAGLIFLLIL